MSFCLLYSLKRLLAKPLLLVGMFAVLCIIGFYAHQDIALEHFYSWPYSTMESDDVINVVLDEGESDLEKISDYLKGSECVSEYSMEIERGNRSTLCSVYGISNMSSKELDRTVFNSNVTGLDDVDDQSVLIDSGTAAELHVKAGDTITLIPGATDKRIDIKVTDVIPPYGPTAGIIASNSRFMGVEADSVNVFCDSSELEKAESFLETLGDGDSVELSIQTKLEAQEASKRLAEEFLPFARQDMFQLFCCALYIIIFTIFFSIVANDRFKNLVVPLTKIGLSVKTELLMFLIEMMIVGVLLSLASSAISLALLRIMYSLPLTPALWSRACGLALAGMVFAAAVASAIDWARVKRSIHGVL